MKKILFFSFVLLLSLTTNAQTNDDNILVIQVSVLRYYGKPIDVNGVEKSDYNFTSHRYYHKIIKSKIKKEDIIEMVSNFDWKLDGEYLSKEIESDRYSEDREPNFITRRTENIKFKF